VAAGADRRGVAPEATASAPDKRRRVRCRLARAAQRGDVADGVAGKPRCRLALLNTKRRKERLILVGRNDLERIVAKRAEARYMPEEPRWSCCGVLGTCQLIYWLIGRRRGAGGFIQYDSSSFVIGARSVGADD